MTKRHSFPLSSLALNKKQLLSLAADAKHCQLLDSNQHRDQYSQFDWMLGWGAHVQLECHDNSFMQLRNFCAENRDWLLGHLSYSLKDEVEQLNSRHSDPQNWPKLGFFVPETLVIANEEKLVCYSYCYASEQELKADLKTKTAKQSLSKPQFQAKLSKSEYLSHVNALKAELQAGNIYEVNFCQAWYAEEIIEPLHLFESLNAKHAAPFSSFYRWDDRYLLCFSPERYLQKRGNKVISQPIKGTAARAKNKEEDQKRKDGLLQSEKERAENVMIVDLVRNDLSRTAAPASVKVEELFGLYSFNAVHQMISTISSRLNEKYDLIDLLATTFPMGSMTGAPKISAMKLIDAHEDFNRGLYSGSVGYISPEGDCDFNVIIRSILYNESLKLAEVKVGGAITIHCNAEEEYQECLLKAEKVIGH